jgi:hypothetical protein
MEDIMEILHVTRKGRMMNTNITHTHTHSGPLTYKLNSFPRAGRNSRLFFPQEIMEIPIIRSETPKAPLT